MKRRLAIKRLTKSDLTLFEWQFHNQKKGGNQKAINLNRNVFIDLLYPSLPEWALNHDNRIPLDLYLLGPGIGPAYNVQRKIIKQPGSYKNWRLNGEFIFNPDGQPSRFNVLQEGDYVLFEFEGTPVPFKAKALMIAKGEPLDTSLYDALNEWMGGSSMQELPYVELESVVANADPILEHPIFDFLLDSDFEDAVLGGARGKANLFKRHAIRPITKSALQKARKEAEVVGLQGEEILNSFLEKEVSSGKIKHYEWISLTNAVAPYDFKLVENDGTQVFVDAKSTTGEFARALHVSMNELLEMANHDLRYDIYRLYEVSDSSAKIRVCKGLKNFAREIIETFRKLPDGVRPDSVSIQTNVLSFGKEYTISYPDEQEEC